MTLRQRQWVGVFFFVLMFGHFGVNVYSTWLNLARIERSYDGWAARGQAGGKVEIVRVDPGGPAIALQPGDEFISINGVTLRDDPQILNYYRRVSPGTLYTMTVRRQGQSLELTLSTASQPIRRWLTPIADMLVQLLFLLTGLIVFLLKPADRQAWLLALMLCTFTGLFNNDLPPLPLALLIMVAFARILGLAFLPIFFQFFLIFPERSPLLSRFPRLERWLYVPFYLSLPWFSFTRAIVIFGADSAWGQFIRNSWMPKQRWIGLLSLVIGMGYLIAGLVTLLIGYRTAGIAARRKLLVIVAGSGAGTLNLLLLILWESFFQDYFPQAKDWLEPALKFTLPLIPLSFAYAIIRHRVIPISLILRRGVRYLLVSRGSVLIEAIVVILAVTAVLTYIFSRFNPPGIVIGTVSAAVAIVVWKLEARLHEKYLAPIIDRKFFRDSYNSHQIIADLTDSLRSTTSLPQLCELVATKIQSALKTENVVVLLRNGAAGDYSSDYSCEFSSTDGKAVACQQPFHLRETSLAVANLKESGQPLEVDSYEDADLREMKSALLLPLITKQGMPGIVSLGVRLGDLPFSGEDKALLMSVSGPTTFAIENSRLVERMIEEARRREEIEAENEQRAKELEEARQLQISMLPKTIPTLPHLEIAAYMKTATEVGGDYYDFHLSDDGTLTVAVGDATGHGLKAGTMVTAMKSLFHCLAREPELVPMLSQSSRVLKAMNLRSLFMGLTMAKLRGSELKLSCAGMPPIFIYREQAGYVEEVSIQAMPLGSMTSYVYREQSLLLEAGDVVVMMSDGLPERFNGAGEMFDYDRVRNALAETARKKPQEIVEHLAGAGDDWANGLPQDDDVTLVVLKLKKAGEKES